mgnify:FL=1
MLKEGEETTVLVARRGKIIELPMQIQALGPDSQPTPGSTWNLVRVDKPTETQEKNWKAWLGIPDAPASGQK